MHNKKSKKLNFLLICILVIGLILAVFFIYEVNALKNTVNDIKFINLEIFELRAKLDTLNEYEKNYDEVLSMLEKYKTALPTSAKESSIIISINKLAFDNTIKLNSIVFQERKKDGELVKIPISMSLTGDYFNIVNFITDIRNDERIFNINSITVQREKESSKSVTAYITLNAYIVS